MKTPAMIELFAKVQEGRGRRDEPLAVKNEFRSIVDASVYQLDAADDSDPEVYRAVGQTMTLGRLCEAMITVSSNLATNLLIDKLGAENIRRTAHSLHADGMQVRRGVEDVNSFGQIINSTTTARALLILLHAVAKSAAVDQR